MSGAESPGSAGGEPPDTGRYCYCLVSVPETASTGDPVHESGVGDGEPYLVVEDGIGAVVQERGAPFESDDEDVVAGWLVSHQSVVDAAAERYGTPLPFRFDVVLAGGDDRVRDWIRARSDRIDERLASFAGRWEYRIQLLWDGDPEPHLLERDERLRELDARRETADGGTGFLVEKQYDRRLREARSERVAELETTLSGAVEPVAVETTHHERSPVVADRDPITRVAVLASGDDEERLGRRLESIADEPAVKVRFTGPWPPYSFAPSFDGGDP